MRWLLLSIALVTCSAQSQETSNNKAVVQEQQKAEQRKADAEKRSEPIKKPKAKSEKKTGKNADSNADEKLNIDRELVKYTGQLAVYTEKLSKFTFWLVIATVILGLVGIWQGVHLSRSVEADIKGERPYLFPGNLQNGLLPSGADALYKNHGGPKPWVRFLFHNIGRSPAILDKWCTVLYLGKKLPYPAPIVQATVFEAQTPIRGGEWYPPEGDKQFSAGLTCEYERNTTAEEIEAIKQKTLFFFLYGYVIYRDFFGFVHEKRFCFKSYDLQGLGVYGGEAYNYENSKRVPKERLWLKYLIWRAKKILSA